MPSGVTCDRGSTPMGSLFGVGATPILVDFSGDWDVHRGYGVLTHSHVSGTLCSGGGPFRRSRFSHPLADSRSSQAPAKQGPSGKPIISPCECQPLLPVSRASL